MKNLITLLLVTVCVITKAQTVNYQLPFNTQVNYIKSVNFPSGQITDSLLVINSTGRWISRISPSNFVSISTNQTIAGTKIFTGGIIFQNTTNVFRSTASGFDLTISPPTLTQNRTITFPNNSGTVALQTDIGSYASSLVTTNTTVTPLSSAMLNSTYPTVPVRFEVVCTVIGIVYKKYDSSNWYSTNITILP